jgi:hypothetical protein
MNHTARKQQTRRTGSLPFALPGAFAQRLLKAEADEVEYQEPIATPSGIGHSIGQIAISLNAKHGDGPPGPTDDAPRKEREEREPEEEEMANRPVSTKKGDEDSDGCFQLLHSEGSRQETGRVQFAQMPVLNDLRGSTFSGKVEWGRPAKFPQIFGYTVYDANQIERWPSFTWKSTLEKTDAVGTSWQAYATPAREQGYKVTADDSTNLVFQTYVLKYPNYNYYVRVSPKAAEIIAAAEQQHINDLSEGWEITGEATSKAINEVAGQEPDVRADAVGKVEAKLGALGKSIHSGLMKGGRLEDSLRPLLDTAAKKSKEARDDSKKHDLGLNYVMADDQRKAVLFEVNEDFKLDKTTSKDVVNLKSILPDQSGAAGAQGLETRPHRRGPQEDRHRSSPG